MKTEQPLLTISVLCNQPGGVPKNRFVDFSGNLTGDMGQALGVCSADTNDGEMMPVVVQGIVLAEAGEALGVGSPVESYDNGTAIFYGMGGLSGYAMDEATEAGQVIRVMLV